MNIYFITDRKKNDTTLLHLQEIFNFHGITIEYSTLENLKFSKWSSKKIILIDQIINGDPATQVIDKIASYNRHISIYMFSSKKFTEDEETTINKNKISIFSLPINENEIFNRIIN